MGTVYQPNARPTMKTRLPKEENLCIIERMKWLEIAIYTTDAGIEPVCGALSSVGLDQVLIEESRARALAFLNECALYWDYADVSKIGVDTPCVKAYVSDTPEGLTALEDAKLAVEHLRTLDVGVDMGPLALVIRHVDDADWAENWKKSYHPLPVGEKLLVLPGWETVPEGNERIVLTLDPGVTFGTGTHHTTRMCLELMEQAVRAGDAMLDLGCGSGILSIAAVLLGAKSAVAVDIDPIAERIALENAAVNGIASPQYQVHIGDVLTDEALRNRIRGQYDVVAANIVADVIIRLAPFAYDCCKQGAAFLISGVIDERKDEVLTRLTACGFTIETVSESGGWVAALCRR